MTLIHDTPFPDPANTPRCELRLEDITRVFAGKRPVTVLRGASLTVQAGQVVTLMGPSGCGKSTLMHIAGLLEPPTTGEVWIAGHAAHTCSRAQRTRMRRQYIGFVFQAHHLLPEYTALENVVLPQRIAGVPAKRARTHALDLLTQVKLDHRADHLPSDLSGGEQQRVAIARAMANAPRFVLADEPTGNLDEQTGQVAFDSLVALARQGDTGLLLVTHDRELGERGDLQVTLQDGKIRPRD